MGDHWKFKSDDHTSAASIDFAKNLRCVSVENRGKLVDEAQDLQKKNREVWVVEATYELRPGASTPEVTLQDLLNHLSLEEQQSLPWVTSKRMPEIRTSYMESNEKCSQAAHWKTSIPSASLTKRDVYDAWTNAGYELIRNEKPMNTLGEEIDITLTNFLPTIEMSFDSEVLIRWSSLVGVSNPLGIVNQASIASISPGCLYMKPWRVEQRYFFKTWTEEEWPAYANITTVTPYWHYSLEISFDSNSFTYVFRNESLNANHYDRFASIRKVMPMLNVTTTLNEISGNWASIAGRISSVTGLSGLTNGTFLLGQSEYSYLNTLLNKSTSNIEYGQTDTLGTCEATTITSPVPLSLSGECSLDKDRVLSDTVGWHLFLPFTPINFTTLFTSFGFTTSVIERIFVF